MSLKTLKQIQWEGYLRQDKSKGIRNKILVVYTVACSSYVAKEIVRQINHSDVEVIGFEGCTDNAYAIRLLTSLIVHPNVGGILAIGLGCEYTQANRLAETAQKHGRLAEYFYIQESGGTADSIVKGMQLVNAMLEKLKHTPKVPMWIEDLVIGAECGGSEFTSGLAGNVVVGRFYDILESCGGTPIFEEIVETVGLIELLKSRAANEQAKNELVYTYYKALEYCKSVHQYSVSPGNFAGGLSTIEEKSMGALIKSGTKPIQGVLKVGMNPPKKGLWLLDSTPDPGNVQYGITNPNDNEGLMDLISCGSHLVFLVTGRGNVVGSAVVPVIKITGNSETYQKLKGDMDFNAGLLLDGNISAEQLGFELADYVLNICRGQLTKAESLGHAEYFIPYKNQDKTVTIQKECKF